ncbi:hypothetical protein LZ30DRAFT_318111 [Colletotrichum cereale]|nr:hypothetical protein LZ30DRAFT_318111 [Colletotrichum cereale]
MSPQTLSPYMCYGCKVTSASYDSSPKVYVYVYDSGGLVGFLISDFHKCPFPSIFIQPRGLCVCACLHRCPSIVLASNTGNRLLGKEATPQSGRQTSEQAGRRKQQQGQPAPSRLPWQQREQEIRVGLNEQEQEKGNHAIPSCLSSFLPRLPCL